MGEGFVDLASAIEVLRQELLKAQLDGAGRDVSFDVVKATVEFTIEAKTTGGGGVGLRFGLFSVDAKADQTSGSGHKLTLELTPANPSGGAFRVASGASAPTPD